MIELKNKLSVSAAFSPGRLAALVAALLIGAAAVSAQGYYDDDLYYDASKAKKQAPAKSNTTSNTASRGSNTSVKPEVNASDMYYYDGASYVPWNNVGEYYDASLYQPSTQGAVRDVDEYNRRGASYASTRKELADSITLEQFEQMSATESLARFNGSKVAQEALGGDGAQSLLYNTADLYTQAYNAGFNNGYNEGFNTSSTTVSLNFGMSPYYSAWDWPYYSSWGRYYYGWNYPYYNYGWNYYDPFWAWGPSWAWTPGWGPSWSLGWGPGWGPGYGWCFYPGPGWGGGIRPTSPTASHRPRGTQIGSSRPVNTGNSGLTSRPGYREPITGRNSHFGTASGSYSSGSSAGRGGSTSAGRPATSTNRGSFGASQSTRTNSGSFNSSGSSRSGSFSSGNRSAGSSHSSGSSSGSRGSGGGGGHRSR